MTPFKATVATLCAYEVLALLTNKIPTLTQLHKRHSLIGTAIMLGLAYHFYAEERVELWAASR